MINNSIRSKVIFLIVITFVLLRSVAYGFYEPVNNSGGFPGEFINSFGSNAKFLALGSASVGSSKSSALSYFNPASTSDIINKEVILFYAPLFNGASFNFIGVSYPISDGSVLGVSRFSLDVGGIDKTDSSGNFIGTTSVNESCYVFSYGYKLADYLLTGVNLKIVNSSMDIYSSTGYGIDFGVVAKPFSFLNCGLNIQNVIPPQITLNSEKERYPTNIRLGISAGVLAELYLFSDVLFMNVFPQKSLYSNDYKLSVRWFEGIEYKLFESFAVRGGINYKEITGGIGYSTRDFDLDYGVGFHTLGITHRVSLDVRFGLLLTETEKWIEKKEKEVDFKTYYSRAVKLFNEKKYMEAREELKSALNILPDNKEAKDLSLQVEYEERFLQARTIIGLAFMDFENGKENDAKGKIEQAKIFDAQILNKVEEEYLLKSQKLIEERKYEDAKKVISKILFVNPDNKQAQELFKKLQSIMEFVE